MAAGRPSRGAVLSVKSEEEDGRRGFGISQHIGVSRPNLCCRLGSVGSLSGRGLALYYSVEACSLRCFIRGYKAIVSAISRASRCGWLGVSYFRAAPFLCAHRSRGKTIWQPVSLNLTNAGRSTPFPSRLSLHFKGACCWRHIAEEFHMNRIPDLEPGPELGQWIWSNLVPKSGQSETVQGELLRANEKLRDEAQRNGNINWDVGFEILLDFLEATLCEKKGLFSDPSKALRSDLKRLRDFEHPYTEDDLFDRIEGAIYMFCLENRGLIPRKANDELQR